MRKPTIQAKPKLNRPVIPAGATIVSTTTVNKESSVEEASLPPPPAISKDKRTATITSLPRPANNNIPYFSANDDINGFKTSLQNKVIYLCVYKIIWEVDIRCLDCDLYTTTRI